VSRTAASVESRRMPAPPRRSRRATPLAVLGAALSVAGCSSGGGQPSPSPTAGLLHSAAAGQTPAGVPYHYQALGEGSSPELRIDAAGDYAVAWVLRGSDQSPGCTVSIELVADDGTTEQVVSLVRLQPADTRQGNTRLTLAAATWRFQEGGGCSWQVDVTRA